jgi:hypothetical protein
MKDGSTHDTVSMRYDSIHSIHDVGNMRYD